MSQPIEARRGIDLLFVRYHRVITLPVPVCKDCKRKRRIAGAGSFLGILAVIFGGGLLCVEFSERQWGIATATLAGFILLVAVLARLGLTDLVNWMTIGLHVVWRKGEEIPLDVRFRNREYFEAWRTVNPRGIVKES